MSCTEREVKQYVSENDVKFVKLTFCDMMGKQKNVSIVPAELNDVFVRGHELDVTLFDDLAASDKPLYMFPDPNSLYVLPWRPQSGRVVSLLCDLKYADGSMFEGDSRKILSDAVARLDSLGYEVKIGTSCEFYVLKTDDDGNPVFAPYDRAGYCDTAPIDKCENIRRDIILNLDAMGISPVSSHHERGKGQNQIVFKPSDPVTAAKNLLTYKSAVRNICVRDGVYATFMPKPFADDYGSGLYISFTVNKKGEEKPAVEAQKSFTEGIMKRVREITAFTNPSVNSYRRFATLDAAHNVSWSGKANRAVVRISDDATNSQLNSPDNACNPYLVLALLIHAGADGVEKKQKLRAERICDPNRREDVLPITLEEALEEAENSVFVKKVIPAAQLSKYIELKRREIAKAESDDIESERSAYLDC